MRKWLLDLFISLMGAPGGAGNNETLGRVRQGSDQACGGFKNQAWLFFPCDDSGPA